jgi:ATPase subunit of ABC transporter with duplicated ATPase domains
MKYIEIDQKKIFQYRGNLQAQAIQKQARLEFLQAQYQNQQTKIEQLQEFIDRNRAKASKATQAQSRVKQLEKIKKIELPKTNSTIEFRFPPTPAGGKEVITLKNVKVQFGEKQIFEKLNWTLSKGTKVIVTGVNGAGKTTLFKLITGEEKPDSGTFKIGETVKLAYVDQLHKDMDPTKTVFEAITGGTDTMLLGNKQINSRAYVSRFNFSGADQQKKIDVLSGGERNRVHLAMMLKQGANVILLDEPSNDIDVNTLRSLEEALDEFGGCAVVISHDRWFLDRICTHILAFEGNSQVYYFEGNYSEYEENKKKRLGDEAPKRIRYKKLST